MSAAPNPPSWRQWLTVRLPVAVATGLIYAAGGGPLDPFAVVLVLTAALLARFEWTDLRDQLPPPKPPLPSGPPLFGRVPRTAVLAGVFANLPALEAVLADARAQRVERIVCLGDLACAGPHDWQVIQRIREVSAWCLRGMWDRHLGDLEGLAGSSMILMNHAVEQAHARLQAHPSGPELLAWLASRPEAMQEGDLWFGVYPPPKPEPREACTISMGRRGYSFLDGHPLDRLPAGAEVGLLGPLWQAGLMQAGQHGTPAADLPPNLPLSERLILCVGSVGNPSGDDPRASYLILDQGYATFRRVEYDVAAFLADYERTDLPPQLGERRRRGEGYY